MSWDPSAYGRAFADVYDDWYGDRDDTGSVVDALTVAAGPPAGRRLLELGVGTGRLAIPLVAAGWAVAGLDASPEMLAVLAAKATGITAVPGDAAVAADYPPGPFDVVLAAYNFVVNLPDRGARLGCLSACAQVSSPGGLLVVEAFVPGASPPAGPVSSPGPVPGTTISTRFDPDTGQVLGEHRHTDGRIRPWRVHPTTPAELDAETAWAGWRLECRWENWERADFHPDDSPNHVSIYRRA